jgi:hypothetical protein
MAAQVNLGNPYHIIPQGLRQRQNADKTYRMKEIFTKAFLFYSIKKTHNTDITGHFLFVIANEHYEAAREALRSE